MSNKAGLHFSPLSESVYWGRVNKNGIAVGERRNVTNNFLQIMEMKFPVNTSQKISVNGEDKYLVISVDLGREVIIDGKVIQEGSK